MGKITNLVLNSVNKTSGTITNNLNYEIDWAVILRRDKKYYLSINYMGGYNHINSYRFPYISSNIPINNYTTNTSTNYNLGSLKYIISQQSLNIGSLTANNTDNHSLYLERLPLNNNLNIQILDNFTNLPYYDEFYSVIGAGTAGSSSSVFTVVTLSSGIIQLGTVITISGNTRTIISFLSGTGGVGTYQLDSSLTVGTVTAFSFPANTIGNPPAPYILTLSFEEVEE